ncbi:MAG: hypothetical protein ISS33_07090 [Candidatus Omnitrophica bacterium]|nr:hypothetical protein [Candidatus Omnitrophota bacterium]
MDIKNIEKMPDKSRPAITSFLEALEEAYGEDLLSVFAYGSATTADYNPKTSDINIAVVLKDVSIEILKKAASGIRKAVRNKIVVPLFLTPEYIKRSLDSFPIEFITMKDFRCVLFGEDSLKDVEVKKEDLQRECEYQLKGKLLMVRQVYLERVLRKENLELLIKKTFQSLMPVFQGILKIRSDAPISGKQETLSKLSEEFNLDMSVFQEVLKDKKNDGKIGSQNVETFLNDFLQKLRQLSEIVDKM